MNRQNAGLTQLAIILTLIFSVFFSTTTHAEMHFKIKSARGSIQWGSQRYPIGPDLNMTPGKLCDRPTSKRYAENINYCERDVSGGLKNKIIADYDKELGFEIRQMSRQDFKIDHFIPLSIGGSNDVENLWPQHKSVYKFSDPIELQLSELMVAGKIKQSEAIRLIKECKYTLPRCADISQYLSNLAH